MTVEIVSDVDVLRAASALMRKRAADTSTEFPWSQQVTLAVADWLDAEAKDADKRLSRINTWIPTADIQEVVIQKEPLALARLYLSTQQSK